MLAVSARTFCVPHQNSTKYMSAAFEVLRLDRYEFASTQHPGFSATTTLKPCFRIWMQAAVRKEITSFGTFLSTLCHEFCHHLDFHKFRFPDSWHTRGFYERSCHSVPLCAGNFSQEIILDIGTGRPVAD